MNSSDQKQAPVAVGSTGGSALPTCAWCKRPMRHNVPRLGAAGGWVHAETGKLSCEEIQVEPPFAQTKVRWPHISKHPHAIAHLRDIIARLETPMLPNTKAATLDCLDELLRRLEADLPNVPSEPRDE